MKKTPVLCILVLFVLTGCTTSEIEYETSRDEVIYSPSGNYSITLRYDYVSRPYIFKDDTLVSKQINQDIMKQYTLRLNGNPKMKFFCISNRITTNIVMKNIL